MIEKLRKENENLVLVDAGDMFFKEKNIPEIRADYILRGMEKMGYDAVTLGEGELNMPFEFLFNKLEAIPMGYVSSNVQIFDTNNKPILMPYVIKKFKDLTVGITGVTPGAMVNQAATTNPRVAVNPPMEYLKQTLSELSSKCDFIILLSHFGFEGTDNLVRYNEVNQASLVVAGHGRRLTQKPLKIGKTMIVQSSMGGEYLGVLKLKLDSKGKIQDYTHKNIALTDEVPEDRALLGEMERFRRLDNADQQTEDEKREKEAFEKKQKEILQLSPEAFLKQMKQNQMEDILDGKSSQ